MTGGSKGNYVDWEFLTGLVGWVLHRRADDMGAQFALTFIDFHNPYLLGEAYGAQRAAHLLDDFGISIVNSLRSGDMVARYVSTFCVLTPTGNIDLLLERLRGIIATSTANGLDFVDYSVRSYIFPCDLPEDLKGETLLGSLSRENTLLPPHLKIESMRASLQQAN
jgi:GGDEF domain-containing protein